MPILKTFLPDVNVWLALATERHIHSRVVSRWFQTVGREQAVFCRVTQMGLLRLLTNSRVMGADVLTRAKAWEVCARMFRDARIRFMDEPPGLEQAWRQLTTRAQPATNLWTDGYLLAFASAAELQFVSFDKGLSAPEERLLRLM